MGLRGRAAMVGLRESLDFQLEVIDRAELAAMTRVAAGLKEDYRDQVRAAGLSERLAKTWQGKVYPNKDQRAGPAAFVYSKAPAIISLLASGATVRPVNGTRYLWIPSRNVPRGSGRNQRAMTPEEVRARYGRFIYRPSTRTAGNMVALVQPRRGNRRGGRGAAVGGLVHMFTLARSARGLKAVDLDGPYRDWAAQAPGLIEVELEGRS